MTNFNDTIKKIDRINNRLIEFDILKKMDNPPGSVYFSDNFRNYCQALRQGEILLPREEHPEDISIDDLPSTEEQMMIDMVMFYLIKVKQTPPEILNSFKAEDYVEFVTSVEALFRLDEERRADPDGYQKRMGEYLYRRYKDAAEGRRPV